MVRFVVVGHLAINETHTQYGLNVSYGGAAAHVAFAAVNILGPDGVGLISVCGHDYQLNLLSRLGVNLSGITISPNQSDRFIIYEKNGKRSFRQEGNLSENVKAILPQQYHVNKIKNIHLATSPPNQQINWIEQIEKQKSKRVNISADTFEIFVQQHPKEVAKVVKSVHLFFANQVEGNSLTQESKNTNDFLLKKGAEGAEFYHEGALLYHADALRIRRVVDTTGAGEIFAGTFLACRVLGIKDDKALIFACQAASLKTKDYGVEHLLTDKHYVSLIKCIHYAYVKRKN